MTIELTEQIDITTINDQQGRIYLNISDHLAWQQPNKRLLLQQKINHYLKYIESGEMRRQHSQARQLNPFIKLISLYPPSESDIDYLLQITAIIEEAGYSFDWQCFDPASAQMTNQALVINKADLKC
jgi:hypothetical protein